MNTIAMVLFTIVGVLGSLLIVGMAMASFIMLDRTRVIIDISNRLVNVEGYLKDLSEMVEVPHDNHNDSEAFYRLEDGRVVPPHIQVILENITQENPTVKDEDLHALHEFFTEINHALENEDLDDEDDEPWKGR